MSFKMQQGGGAQTHDVFVGNIWPGATEEEVTKQFIRFGEIQSVLVKEGNRNDGTKWGFVRFYEDESAAKAVKENNGLVVKGHALLINRGTNNKKMPGGSTGGSGGGQRQSQQQQNTYANKPDLVAQHQPSSNKSRLGGGIGRGEVLRSEKLMATHVEGPLAFWGQSLDEDKSLHLVNLSESLQMLCKGAPVVTGTPHSDKMYATIFSQDGMWYRCKYLRPISGLESEVQFIDYGNAEVKLNSELVELPSSIHVVGPFAKKYVLYGLKPIHDTGTMGYLQGTDKLRELTENQLLECDVMASKNDAVVPIVLTVGDIDINQEMLNLGFGERRFMPMHQSQWGGAGKGKANSPSRNQSSGQVQSGKKPNINVQVTEQGNRKSFMGEDKSGPHDSYFRTESVGSGGGDQNVRSSDVEMLRNQLQQAGLEISKLQSELHQQRDRARHEANMIKDDRDMKILELGTERGKLKKMEQDMAEIKDQLGKSNIANRIRTLHSHVNKVKLLRCQFPTEDQTEDLIDKSLRLIMTESEVISLDNLEIINQVKSAHDAYRFLQDRIKSVTELSQFEELTPGRDSARVQLQNRLTEFLSQIGELPLETRQCRLQQTYEDLLTQYGAYEKPNTTKIYEIGEICELYSTWKEKKNSRFQVIRTDTNTRHNLVNNALRVVQQQLSLDDLHLVEDNPKQKCLDDLMDDFQKAVSDEIKETDMERFPSDASFVTLVVSSLTVHLQKELSNINQLLQLKEEYGSLRSQLQPWLSQQPDTAPLKAVRKTIKSLKSKLRHKLADKQDLEENEEPEEDLKQVMKDICEIRTELHKAFQQEDDFLSKMSDLNEKHFPELQLQHPDMGIDNEMKYAGLVKLGRSLDQYDLEPLAGVGKQTIHKSQYCDKPVVIKEYIVDDSIGVKKSDALRRAVAYKEVSNSHVMPIDAIFFLKNERQVCIQLPYYESNVARLVEEGEVGPQMTYMVLRGLLQGIHSLHDARLVHGAVHPNNVFVTAEGQAQLAEYDFTKTLEQRAEKVYESKYGLRFIAPELCQPHQASMAADIYNFGLFVLWLHCPTVTAINDVSQIIEGVKEVNLKQLLKGTLDPNPSARCTASELSMLPYFNVSLPRPPSSGETKLQLKPKQPSPPKEKSGGILKNARAQSPSSASPTSTKFSIEEGSAHEIVTEKVAPDTSSDVSAIDSTQKVAAHEVDMKDALIDDAMPVPDTESDVVTKDGSTVIEETASADRTTQMGNISTDGTVPDLLPQHQTIVESPVVTENDTVPLVRDTLGTDGGTPTLPCTPMGTPMNTPTEVEESLHAKKSHGDSPVRKLMEEAARLASEQPLSPVPEVDNEEKVLLNGQANSQIQGEPCLKEPQAAEHSELKNGENESLESKDFCPKEDVATVTDIDEDPNQDFPPLLECIEDSEEQ